MDPEHTLLLSDGLRAGSGDAVIARGNNRKLVDTDGNFVSNGTLFDVQQVIRRDRSLLARRRDTGASVILPGAYLESSVELGYATTGRPQPKPIQLLNFLGLLVLGLIIFTFNAIYPISSLGLFLLPVIPLVRLALGPAQAAPPLRG